MGVDGAGGKRSVFGCEYPSFDDASSQPNQVESVII